MSDVIPEPIPIQNEREAIWDLVIADMRERDSNGLRKYGKRLQPFNGRRAVVDAYQEALDLVVYIKQEIEERKQIEARLTALERERNDAQINLIEMRKIALTDRAKFAEEKRIETMMHQVNTLRLEALERVEQAVRNAPHITVFGDPNYSIMMTDELKDALAVVDALAAKSEGR